MIDATAVPPIPRMRAEAAGTVHAIWRYPVSSLAGEALGKAFVAKTGLEGDRTHALYEAGTGGIVFPSIEKRWNVAPQLSARLGASGTIEVSADGSRWRPSDDPALADDLETFFGTRMVLRPYGSRIGNEVARQRYAWQPIHLLSRQALEALQAHLPGSRIDVRRFRPNIVVDLPDLPGSTPEYALLGREFTIGGLRLRGTVRSGRCSFTTLAQQGLDEDRAVLRGLIDGFEKDFGIYCEVLEAGEIALGDSVRLAQRPIVIVGAGQAGAMTAKALRDLGWTAPIRIFGDERHLPYERPPLSKGDENAAASHVLSPDQIETLDIDLDLNSRVAAIHREACEIETQDGERHPYDRLVLATGGTARRVPGIERGHGRVHVIRTLEDAAGLRGHLTPGAALCVLGSGWLGLEIAAAARKRGCAVTLFARQDRVLARTVPRAVAAFVAARHAAEGVGLRLGETPSFRERRDRVEIVTERGLETADDLVLAIGITVNDQLGRAAGLDVDGGIVTDASGATSDPRIFAVGDVARQRRPDHPAGIRIESWQNANDQPHAAARAILALPAAPLPPPRFWSEQYDMTIQIAGLPDPDAEAVRCETGENPFWDYGRFAVGINRAREIHQFAARLAADPADDPVCPPPTVADMPAQRREPAGEAPVGKACSFSDGEIRRIDVPSLGTVAVLRLGERFFAVDDRCPHAEASLSEGFVERQRIVCPVHFAEFDLETGVPFNAPSGCGRLACYRIERRGDDLFLLF